MKYNKVVLIASVFSLSFLSVCSQTKTRTEIRQGGRLDTNKVVYDEQGIALKYHQYTKLLNTGEYTIRISGDPSDPKTKHFLKKQTIQEQMESAERIKTIMAVPSPLLKVGMKLNMEPFFEEINKEELEQKIKVLIFWSPDCPPCTESFESVNEIFMQIYNPEEILTLAVTRSSKNESSRKLKEKPLLYAKLISDASGVFTAYKLNAYPTFIIADKNDIIQLAVTGLGAQVMSVFKNQLRAMVNQ